MRPTRRDLNQGLLAGLIGFGLPGGFVSARAQEPPRKGGTLVYALGGDPAHLNIAITSDLNAQQVATQIFSQLLRVDKDTNVTGDLAATSILARGEKDQPITA